MQTKSAGETLFSVFFWLFNLTLLLIAYVGILPFLGTAIITDALKGEVPFDLLLPLVGLVGVPTTTSLLSLTKAKPQALENVETKERKFSFRSLSTIELFYGVEAPLLVLCLVRFFWLKELNPSSTIILLAGCVSIGAYLHQLIYGKPTTVSGAWIKLACNSLIFAIALYVLTLSLFYAIPISAAILYGLLHTPLETLLLVVVYGIILSPIGVVIILSATIPFGMAWIYIRSWQSNLNDFALRYGWTKAYIGTIAVIMSGLIAVIAVQKQPQVEVFAALQKPITTERDRFLLLQKSEQIRKGLLNAYLATYRYQDYGQENTNIRDLYNSVFPLGIDFSQSLQNTYNVLVSPFLYDGKRTDRDTATKLYSDFFDVPILRGEQKAVQKAVQATFNRSEAKAGLLDINEKKVWLAEQQVKVTPQGDWAEVELYEIYENQTFDSQEIVYSFSLPPSAVITGVWLGNSSDLSARFPFTVSTRGAAQKVYTEQVRRNVDPALLEQIGPNSYRLRAFPVLPRNDKPLHLWMTYQVLQTKDGIALPQLSERRNIFWTKDTKRLNNGKTVASQDNWFTSAIATKPTTPLLHQINLNGYQITGKPLSNKDYRLPEGDRIAIVLDTSYSMGQHSKEAVKTFKWLKEQAISSNDFDVYITSAPGVAPKKLDDLAEFDVERATFYGTMQPLEMLRQFENLRGDSNYDAILLISDRGSYELGSDTEALKLPAPLWIVHLGGVQSAYDDAIFETIQASGGGVATQVQEVMQRFATQKALAPGVIGVEDNYAWFAEKNNISADPNNEFNPFAARQLINYLGQDRDLKEIANLDGIHQVAKASQIVTPYSSMIVLVNDQQKNDLKQAEQKSDRFKREIEDKQMPTFNNPLAVSAVPEPAEWMLIIVGAIALVVIIKRKKEGNVVKLLIKY
ncbi:TIGR02921 family PEP-CTERM protein [Synechocystis sp. PCC 7509]|uniref:TIGR02921 family PEP-CTERM protein n=1 Tax=Synechocystis sp. PCC 7509 TaxID=927677 RepID=UPI0002AD0892|nr:TIGR02921 family PEP-CTERM protein [Synechocystis sp. PCC 7509]